MSSIISAIVIFVTLLAWFTFFLTNRSRKLGLKRNWKPMAVFSRFFSGDTSPSCVVEASAQRNLMIRMDAYAKLQKQTKEPLEDHALETASYLILLGTLKKIESKFATLTAIVVFVAIALVTALPIIKQDILEGIALGLAAFLILMSAIMVGGAHHIDQLATNRRIAQCEQSEASEKVFLENLMKQDLVADLLRKEVEFETCSVTLALSAVITMIIFLMIAVW